MNAVSARAGLPNLASHGSHDYKTHEKNLTKSKTHAVRLPMGKSQPPYCTLRLQLRLPTHDSLCVSV